MRSAVTVLMYHRVLEDAKCAGYPFPSIVMPRTSFATQLDYLAEHARVLTVSAALREVRAGEPTTKPRVCLTFDDGYADNSDIVAPLLENRRLRGTFFITAGAVEARAPLWYDRAAELWSAFERKRIRELAHQLSGGLRPVVADRQSFIEWLKTIPNDRRAEMIHRLEAEASDSLASCPLMTPAQVRHLSDAGHEVGSHTLSHPVLTTMTPEDRRAEIHGAKALLEAWTAADVPGFCYPNGDYDDVLPRQLREAGHVYACTTAPGRNDRRTDPFQLRRIDVTPGRVTGTDGRFDLRAFRAEISMLHPTLRRLSRAHG
jgi:peptidoglycan/xylan/chitin deacetylase (PgdA/CDA1 family)